MRRSILFVMMFGAIALAQCSSDSTPRQTPTEPGHGGLAIAVVPNPIVATRVSGDTYDFPFEVRVSNPGTLPVTVREVQIDVTALGGIPVYSDTQTRTDIEAYGYPTEVAPGQTLSYEFTPRKEVPDDRLFDGVSALLTATGTDTSGKEVIASVRVSVTR